MTLASTRRRRLETAGWRFIEGGWLPKEAAARVQKELDDCEAKREQIAEQPGDRGRPGGLPTPRQLSETSGPKAAAQRIKRVTKAEKAEVAAAIRAHLGTAPDLATASTADPAVVAEAIRDRIVYLDDLYRSHAIEPARMPRKPTCYASPSKGSKRLSPGPQLAQVQTH